MRRTTPLVLSTLLSLAASGCGSLVRYEMEFTQSADWQQYGRCNIQLRNGGVELRTANIDAVRISGTKFARGATVAAAKENLAQLTIYAGPKEDEPGTLLVELRCPRELRNKVGANLVIETPAALAADVQTANGTIRVVGMRDEVGLTTRNGHVYADEITGAVHAETSNGHIKLRDISGDVRAESSNGNVTAEHVGGACALATSNGHLRYSAAADGAGGPVELLTSNGGITATLSKSAGADLELRTVNGRVRADVQDASLQHVDASRTRFIAKMNGGGRPVKAVTANGSVKVGVQ